MNRSTVWRTLFLALATLFVLFITSSVLANGGGGTAVFTVNSAADVNDGSCNRTHCTLREAINAANNLVGDDDDENANIFIQFRVGTLNPVIISPLSPLPAINTSLVLKTDALDSIDVVLDGSQAGLSDGLVLAGNGITVRNLTIQNFAGNGIVISGSNGRIEGATIRNNGQNGILVAAGSGSSFSQNVLSGNSGLGIDLGGDGPTPNDKGDLDEGANGRQNTPVLIRAVPTDGELLVEGILNSRPNSSYQIELYASESCHASGFGEGESWLGSATVVTDGAGNGSFATAVPTTISNAAITALATGSDGTSEFSRCIQIGLGNDAWPRALRLNLTPDGVSPEVQTAEISQRLDQAGQSRWYKFTVQPNSQLVITLTDLPANYDLTVYKDIAAEWQSLLTLDETEDLVQLTAEFAPDAFSPDAFSPDAFSPDAFSPDAFSPDAFSPDAFSPDAFSPDAFSPDAFSPDAFSPDAFSPDAFSPDAFSPDAFSPDAFSPDAFSPDAFSPDAFSSAQMRSLIAVSAFNGTAGEGVRLNTWENGGDFYIRVRGRNGAFDANNSFVLNVLQTAGSCGEVTTALPATTHTAVANNYNTIILVDNGRLAGDLTTLQARLATFAARPEVNGVIVNVGSDARVAAANAQADIYTGCPFAKNLAANAIKDIVDAYRALNPLEYIVIIGNDDVIPFFRHPDQAMLANERNYVPPVLDNTASQASLRLGYVLGQDRYGTLLELSSKADNLPIPQLAVGRLVETPGQIVTMLDAYLSTTNGVVATPDSALVTGYDFLEDAANAIASELGSGLGSSPTTLITPSNIAPTDPASWTANDLRTLLLTNRYDISFLAGHFSASSTLAADYSTRLLASELAASSVDMTNALVFSAGCHSGYNIVDAHGVPNVTAEPDWGQAFASKGATLIAGTGYQYGDTDFIEYGERLYLNFSEELRAGTGPVAIGQALVAAKQTYLAETQELRPLHEKSLIQATLFGLPMLKIDLPTGRGGVSGDPSVVSGTTGFASNPGQTLGLAYADLTVEPSLTLVNQPLDVVGAEEASTVTASYLSGSDGVVVNPTEPVLPLESLNVSLANTVLRGVGFRGGSFTDLAGILPLTGAATSEIRGVHPPFVSNVFYPMQPYQVNYFGQLVSGLNGAVQLNVTPAQFVSDNAAALTGTLRQFQNMDFRLYYSDYIAQSAISGNVPALAAPPAITLVNAFPGEDAVTFVARVTGDPAAGIQEVWVTFTGSGPLAGQWQSLNLVQSANDSTVWSATLPLNGVPAEDVRFMVQAVNGVGLVSAATNLGAYFSGAGTAEGDLLETAVTLQSPPATGTYSSKISVSAQLTADGAPLANQFLSFRVGAQTRTVLTNESGVATAELALLGLPGNTELTVAFGGDLTYQSSFATAPFAITRQATSLTLAPAAATVTVGDPIPFVATLLDGGQRPLGQQTVFFVIEGDNGSQIAAVITDFAGRATLDSVALPVGEYTVDVYFSGSIPLPVGSLTLDDLRYLPSATSGALTIVEPSGGGQTLYLSTASGGQVAGITYSGEDVLSYDLDSGTWSLLFDGSDVGLAGQNVTAFAWLPDGSMLLTLAEDFNLTTLNRPVKGGINVDNSDILRFEPDSLGDNTAGTWSLYLDGSDVDLSTPQEAIRSLSVLADGRIILGTKGPVKVGSLNAKSRDLLIFTPTSLGEVTAGSWQLYFDGSDEKLLSASKDSIEGVHVDEATGSIYLVTSTANGQIYVCTPGSLGQFTNCAFTMFWSGSEAGLPAGAIDAIAIR
ncbi:MAG: CSLREA domain-containing protein [Ardenticatenaceae bacterium]|nr:CSLREA domain-containing protein [Anaerolineales bacterium]MCB8941544.1 CSLREA domain-containing protein [Ardenticatenaceae bacterium]MCB8974562.1 CSLREA domain-containing protein [Ardenticatenaceae bacterium]